MQSLQDFLVDIQSRGVAHTNKFMVFLNPPEDVFTRFSGESMINMQLSMRCEMAELPGMQFMTTDFKSYGAVQKIPYAVQYDNLNLTFLMSSNLTEKHFFDIWMSMIKDDSDNWEYHDKFVSPSMFMTIFDTALNPVYGLKLIGAYPVSIQSTPLNWGDAEVMRVVVSFAYERWIPIKYPGTPTTPNMPGTRYYPDSDMINSLLNPIMRGYLPLLQGVPGIASLANLGQLQNLTLAGAAQRGTQLAYSLVGNRGGLTSSILGGLQGAQSMAGNPITNVFNFGRGG
jgi:hypothetical protein